MIAACFNRLLRILERGSWCAGGCGLALLGFGCGAREEVVISEFMASNGNVLADEEGEYADWIELYNAGDTVVNLDGWHLTDNAENPRRWRLPARSLDPKAHLVVFASGKGHARADGPLHTNFRLKATSDYLALVRPYGSLANEFRPYPDQREDVSYGITSAGAVDFLAEPTPGRLNSAARAPGDGLPVRASTERD